MSAPIGARSESVGRAGFSPLHAQEDQHARYDGPLVDAHLHVPNAVPPPDSKGSRLAEILDADGYAWAIGFYFAAAHERTFQHSARVATEARARVVPLAQPSARTQGGFLTEFPADKSHDELFRSFLRPEGVFAGIGEIPLYFPILQSLTFQSPVLVSIFTAVDATRSVVMLHPRGRSQPNPTTRSEVQEALVRFPNATFLLHGEPDVFDTVEPLIADHPNLFFSFDFPTWSGGPGGVSWGGAVEQSGSAEQYLFSMERFGGIDALAQRGVRLLGDRAAMHPHRTMFGSDRFQTWHFDLSVGKTVVDVNRRILGQLPAELREALAFRTAEQLLGPHLIT